MVKRTMTDDPGVMGNLPRSRPGRRSSKRDTTRGRAKATEQTTEVTAASAQSKPSAGKSAAGRPKKSTPKRTAAKRTTTAKGSAPSRARARASDQPPRQETATHGSTDPVTGAVIFAGKVVEGGLKVAGGIIKRLPRP